LVDETEEDIIESIKNLHFLRFYLSTKKISHTKNPLAISSTSQYYKIIPQDELDHWHINILGTYLPKDYFKMIDSYRLFEYLKKSHHMRWNDFSEISKHYSENKYEYRLLQNDIVIYEEYYNNELINSISFDEPVYWEVLKATNYEVTSLDLLHKNILDRGFDITQNELIEILNNLKNEYLLYSSLDNSKIVSVIDTDIVI